MARKINREINYNESDVCTYDISDNQMIIDEKPLFITKAQPIVEYTSNSDEINTFISSIMIAKVDGKEVTGVGAVEPYCEQVQESLVGIVKDSSESLRVMNSDITDILADNKCNLFVHDGVVFFAHLNAIYATLDGIAWQAFEYDCMNEIEIIVLNGEVSFEIGGETYKPLFKIDFMSVFPIELYLAN